MGVVCIEMVVVRGEGWRLEAAAHGLRVKMGGWGCDWQGGSRRLGSMREEERGRDKGHWLWRMV